MIDQETLAENFQIFFCEYVGNINADIYPFWKIFVEQTCENYIVNNSMKEGHLPNFGKKVPPNYNQDLAN